MIIEVIVGVVVLLIMFYFILQLWDKYKLNKLRRNYNAEDDKSRPSEGRKGSQGNSKELGRGEPILESEISGGDVGETIEQPYPTNAGNIPKYPESFTGNPAMQRRKPKRDGEVKVRDKPNNRFPKLSRI